MPFSVFSEGFKVIGIEERERAGEEWEIVILKQVKISA